MHFHTHSQTQPTLDKSTLIGFSKYSYSYPALQEQFAKAKLKMSHNEWNNIHDFSQQKGWCISVLRANLVSYRSKDPAKLRF
jgi:hypothetical protein